MAGRLYSVGGLVDLPEQEGKLSFIHECLKKFLVSPPTSVHHVTVFHELERLSISAMA